MDAEVFLFFEGVHCSTTGNDFAGQLKIRGKLFFAFEGKERICPHPHHTSSVETDIAE